MEKNKNINKIQKKSLPLLTSEITSINNYKRKEDSRKSSEHLSISDNFSVISSTKGVIKYNFTQNKDKSSNNLFFLDYDFSHKKINNNKTEEKLYYKTKYNNIFNSNKKKNNLKKSNISKFNNIFLLSNKINNSPEKNHKNNYNITILQKFNKDFKKYFINSLDISKNEIQKNLIKIKKINKTFYKINNPIGQNTKKNLNIRQNSSKSEKSKKSFSSEKINKSKENNMENKILKTKYSSQLIKINKNYKRKRNFKEYINEKNFLNKDWNSKLGIIKSNIEYNILLSNDIKFQSGIIKDELCLLIDDIQYFRLTFMDNNDLFSSFKNMIIIKQIKINKILEESCSLLHYITKIILKEYYYQKDKFIAIEDPSNEMFSKKIIYNELETFQDNLKYLYKISNFVRCCGEVYSQLVIQVENEMIISSQNFFVLKQILKRIRFYIIDLTNMCKNILMNYCFDKYVLINKFKDAIKKNKIDDDFKRKITENKENKFSSKKYRLKNPKIKNFSKIKIISKKEKNIKKNNYIKEKVKTLEEKNDEKIGNISNSFGKKNNIFTDKITRISKALELSNIYNKDININNNDKYIEKKNTMKPMGCINSKLMGKMLKYMDKDIKEKIISLRTCERHLHNNNID